MTENPDDVPPLAPATGTESVAVALDLEDEEAPEHRPAELPARTVVANRYEIVSTRGRGGYAVVYRALDRAAGSHVALKVLRADRLGPVALKRLAREAEAARQFTHPRLVKVLDHGRDGEAAFLVMPLVDGQTLRERLRSGPVPTEDAIRIASDVLEALEVIHSQSMVHRDVKPSNILLDADGRAQLADFGLITRWEEGQTKATQSQAIVGTIEYVSPEQALGETLDGRSDLYALGVVLYEMLSGAPLHGARSSLGMLVAHLTKPAPDIRASRESVPQWLAAIVAKLLAKSREERYASATEARADLAAKRAPRGAHPERDAPGRRRLALIAVAVCLLLAIAWSRIGPVAAPAPRIVAADVAAGVLRALDEKGQVAWSRDTGETLDPKEFAPASLAKYPRLTVTDLEGDGPNEVLLSAAAEAGDLRDLLVFESDGRLRFRLPSRHRVTFGTDAFDTFNASTIHAFIDRAGRRRLFVMWTHRPYFPSVIEEITPQGAPLSAYYFSGHQQAVTRLTVRGREVLAVGGFHNETRGGSLTLLDLDKVSGRSPGVNPTYVCGDCVQSDPLALIVFPRSDILVAEGGETGTASVDSVIPLEGEAIDAALQLGLITNAFGQEGQTTIRYQVAPDLSHVLGLDVSKSVQVRHDVLFRARQLDHPFGARDLANLHNVIIWRDGGWKPLPFADAPR